MPRHLMRYRSCVLGPSLALSPHGVAIASSLSRILNIWIVRELWHIFENIDLYLQKPELILSKKIITNEQSSRTISAKEELWYSLKKWETLRNQNDLTNLNLFWLGDSLRESLLPPNQNVRIFQQWEWLASFLDQQIDLCATPKNILTLAFRDAIAMTASLDSAFLLTARYPSSKNAAETPPEICQSLTNWGISCQLITSSELSLIPEREYLRQLLVTTGLTKFLWAGVSFAVLHIILPAASKIYYFPQNSVFNSPLSETTKLQVPNAIKRQTNFWTKSQCFWYPVYPTGV